MVLLRIGWYSFAGKKFSQNPQKYTSLLLQLKNSMRVVYREVYKEILCSIFILLKIKDNLNVQQPGMS